MHSGMQAGAAAVLPFARSASTRARRVSLLLTSSHGPGTRPGFSRRPGEADSRPAPPCKNVQVTLAPPGLLVFVQHTGVPTAYGGP
jgi:hypothetical protein